MLVCILYNLSTLYLALFFIISVPFGFATISTIALASALKLSGIRILFTTSLLKSRKPGTSFKIEGMSHPKASIVVIEIPSNCSALCKCLNQLNIYGHFLDSLKRILSTMPFYFLINFLQIQNNLIVCIKYSKRSNFISEKFITSKTEVILLFRIINMAMKKI